MEAIQTATAEDLKFYEQAAIEYYRSLPLEHFMESIPHATQRKITLESFDLIHRERPDVWCHNELLVQYPVAAHKIRNIRRVVPDNLILLHDGPIKGTGSYNSPFEDAVTFMALEYLSRTDPDKDHVENLVRLAESGFQFYVTVDWEAVGRELIVRRLNNAKRYEELRENERGRFEVPELDLELGMSDGWLRYWMRGELLPLTSELADRLSMIEELANSLEQKIETERRGRLAAEAEVERLKKLLRERE